MKAHTKEEYIAYIDNATNEQAARWDLSPYYSYRNKCMHCGCPPDNPNMKTSPDAYICIICFKKEKGEEIYNKVQSKLNKWEDKTNGMDVKERIILVKKSLMFG